MYPNRLGGVTASPILTLLEKIPQWEETLSSLNQTMDDRQVDLREAEKYNRENASLKRCGSMETLRPDGDCGMDGEGGDSDVNMGDEPQNNGAAPPGLLRSSTSPGPIRYNTRLRKAQAAGESKGDVKPPVLRKRKTESMTSVSATSRKKWNKKEIIVYYQAPVQAAFSSIFDSIKLVGHQLDKVIKAGKATGGTGRSSILDRHKYAIKSLSAYAPNMGAGAELQDLDAEMALEADDNIDADSMLEVDPKVEVDGAVPDELEPEIVPGMKTNSTTTPAREADDLPDLEPDTTLEQNATAIPSIEPDSDINVLLPDASSPPLKYGSARRMNSNLATSPYTRLLAQQSASKPAVTSAPRIDALSQPDTAAAELKADSNAPDIFVELSSDLNSAADIVQEAAHEFLKWGSCRLEIRKVESLLRKLKKRVERGIKEDPTLGAPISPMQSERGGRAVGRWGLSKYGAALANLGPLDGGGDGDLGDLEAADEMNLEVDDAMVLEADEGLDADEALGDLKVDEMHKVTVTRNSIKSQNSTRSAKGSAKQSQYITVIKPDCSMNCSKAGADTTSQSTTSADAPVTPDELDITSTLKSNMSQRNADLMAKYGGTISSQQGPQRVQPIRWYGYVANKSAVSSRMRKSMDVHEVQISPVSRLN